jgi:hypothetical protein
MYVSATLNSCDLYVRSAMCDLTVLFCSQNISIRPIIMLAMAEWYIRGDSDQTKLSHILDVAQDLKVINNLSLYVVQLR